MSDYVLEVTIDHQPIELCKLLKIANLVAGGGEAKIVISEGYVLVNGEPEFQKRKKIYHQDVVEFNGEVIQVLCPHPVTLQEKNTPTNLLRKAQAKKPARSTSQKNTLGRRRPISFNK